VNEKTERPILVIMIGVVDEHIDQHDVRIDAASVRRR
jgi:hypothetical protein